MSERVVQIVECPECGSKAEMVTFTAQSGTFSYYNCTSPLCIYASDTEENSIVRLKARLKENDFALGDSFWIEHWEFTVTNKR